MITFNTNLGALIVQSNLKNANIFLNQAIERMTTGYKVNHAKDNAANFSIINNMNTKINSMRVREDNASLGIQLVSTISSGIENITSHLQKIRNLALSAVNETYGNTQLSSLQQELQTRLDEIRRETENCSFENNKIFEKQNPTITRGASNSSLTTTASADKNTTFDELGITDLNVEVYDSSNSKINSYTFDSDDKIDKFLTVLNNSGFSADIHDGVIKISSLSGNYIKGSLVDALGIVSDTRTVITNSTSQSNSKLTYTTTQFADTTTTFAQVGLNLAGKSLQIKSKSDNSIVGTITIDSNSKSFQDLFDSLSAYGITATMNDGKITLNTSDKYVSGEIATSLGISTTPTSSSTITSGQSTTSSAAITYTIETLVTGSTTLAEMGISASKLVVQDSYGKGQATLTISSTTSLDSLFSKLKNYGITATLSDGVISLSGSKVIAGELANALGIGLNSTSNTILYGGSEYRSSSATVNNIPLPYTNNEVVSSLDMLARDTLVKSVNYKNASNCTDIINVSSFKWGETYKITSTEGLVKLAEMVNNSRDSGEGATFVLMNNIDLSSIDNWTPIGYNASYFRGSFYGNGHTISNMKISSESRYVGLFGYCVSQKNAMISDIVLKDVDITAKGPHVGGLIGYDSGVNMENISISGNISVDVSGTGSWTPEIGGLCGFNNANIDSVNVNINIKGNYKSNHYVGGIVGHNYKGGNINNSYVSGSITRLDNTYVGGAICGWTAGNTISNNKSTMYAEKIIANFSDYSTDSINTISDNKFMNSINTIESNQYIKSCYLGQNTKLSAIGISTEQTIKISYDNNTSKIITVTPDMTCNDIATKLQNSGIQASYFENWTVSSSNTARISEVSGDLRNKTGLRTQDRLKKVETTYTNTSSKHISAYTQSNITGTNKLSDLGITSDKTITVIQNGTQKTVTVKSADTINNISSKLNQVGITLTLNNGKITLNGNNNAFVKAMDSDLASALKIAVGKDKTYSETTKNAYANTQPTGTYSFTHNNTLTSATLLNELKNFAEGSIRVRSKSGAIGTINVTKTDSLQDFFNKITRYNINGSITDGKVTLSSNGDCYLEAMNGGSNLLSVLSLGSVNQTSGKVTELSPSKQLTYQKSLDDWTIYATNFEIGGISSEPDYKIGVNLSFGMNYALDITTKEGAKKALKEVDNMLKYLQNSQSVVGSAENRLMSVLDEISMSYENLISAQSTLRDADVAKESSHYIRYQILQQASATLLSVANQTPSVALNLL